MTGVDVAALAAVVRGRAPVGAVRLVTVDGRSGSGKTSLAAALGAALGGVPVLHLDDLYPGWDGLAAGVALAAERIAEPLLAGRVARWPAWDWVAGAPGRCRELPAAPCVLLEGCGAGTGALRPAASTAIWVDAPAAVRLRRLRDRADWAGYAPHHRAWTAQEDAVHGDGTTRAAADVVVDNGGGRAR